MPCLVQGMEGINPSTLVESLGHQFDSKYVNKTNQLSVLNTSWSYAMHPVIYSLVNTIN